MALTLAAFETVWNTTTDPKTVVVTGCLTGDWLFVIAGSGHVAATITAITTSTTVGSTGSWAAPQENLNSPISEAWLSSAVAQVTADGDVTVQVDLTTATGPQWGFAVVQARDSGGLGVSGFVDVSATQVVNLTVEDGSGVFFGSFDWDAGAVGTNWTPTADVTLIERTDFGSTHTVHVAYWVDQAAGTRDYGSTGAGGAARKTVGLEILGPTEETVTLTAGTPFQATGSVTSGVVTLPPGLVTGDFTFLFCTLNGSSGVITGPGDYATAFASAQSTASTSHATAIYYRAWQSGDTDPTVTCTSGRLAVLPVKVSGADTANPIEGTVGSTTQDAATISVDAPSQTSVTSKLLVTAHAGRSATNGVFITWTPPSGMTEVGEAGGQAAAATNASVEVASELILAGATTGAQTATASSTATGSRGVSLLFKAAAIEGEPPPSDLVFVRPVSTPIGRRVRG